MKCRSHLIFKISPVYLLALLLLFVSHVHAESGEKLIVFHAGSLAVPFKEMGEAFTAKYPGVRVQREPAGSRTCARKITDLKKPCDVMASADYTVIEELLFPNYADWNISFSTNEMALMYRLGSNYSNEINDENWYRILLKKDVEYGHSDPNSDPCGYRSQLVWKLAEKYYEEPGLYQKLKENCPLRNVRPKETDLIAMLEAGQIDYLFIYRSVCEQHNMPFVALPDEINLKSAQHEAFYRQAKVKVTGKRPGEFIVKIGSPMIYGITIPKNAPNHVAAIRFLAFVVGPEGREIMQRNGQCPVLPPEATGRVDRLPVELKNLISSK